MGNFYRRLKLYLNYRLALIYDFINGVDFIKPIDPHIVGLDEKKYYRSSATDKGLGDVFQSNFTITNKDKIIDIGCGKGRAINILLDFEFACVDDIELSKHISQIANNNFIQLNKQDRVSIFSGDATTFDSYDKYNIFYLYNPFSCEIMKLFLNHLTNIFLSHDNEIFIVYRNPTCNDLFEEYDNFYLIHQIEGINPWQTTYIYSNKKGLKC